ncbi:hypothetical protein AK812_SmicGene40558 [Symbiodinium microadriaticum]|uniref:Transmembrane protein n=1 Tax=Symbiodinium microadriaticum TaxID=2951 RepID=A0A1Q9C8G6_SYMMI|nr:hypothetical protein AK812_SmicGene40558 [Symbiodinium microadriaticum]
MDEVQFVAAYRAEPTDRRRRCIQYRINLAFVTKMRGAGWIVSTSGPELSEDSLLAASAKKGARGPGRPKKSLEAVPKEKAVSQAAFGTTKAAQAFVLSVSTAFVAVLLIYWSGAASAKKGARGPGRPKKSLEAVPKEKAVSQARESNSDAQALRSVHKCSTVLPRISVPSCDGQWTASSSELRREFTPLDALSVSMVPVRKGQSKRSAEAAFGTTKAAQAFVLSVSTAFVAVLLIYWSGAASAKKGARGPGRPKKSLEAVPKEKAVSQVHVVDAEEPRDYSPQLRRSMDSVEL